MTIGLPIFQRTGMISTRRLKRKNGFTLVEALISFMVIAMAFFAFEAIMYMQQYFISYSKHKLQAIHAARAVLDMQRAAGFPYIVNQQFLPPAYIGCDMSGATVTVTVLPPYNDPTCAYRKTVQVKVSWNERMNGISVPKQEFLTTDIANEPQLN